MSSVNLLNKVSSKLFGLESHFKELQDLHTSKQLPKISLLSGKKGAGKFTLIFHFINYIFSKKNYDLLNNEIKLDSLIYKQILAGTFQNFIYLNNYDLGSLKIDDIRNLKKTLLNTTLNNEPRFIVIDDADLLSVNCANALLKLIEEPSDKNYFILIDNKQIPIIETIASRCLKTNIFLNNSKKNMIVESILSHKNLSTNFNFHETDISPGEFLNYNEICGDNDLSENTPYETKLNCLLKLYKKEKEKVYINMSIYFTDQYFYKLSIQNKNDPFLLNTIKLNIISQINDFVIYNLNLNLVLNSIQQQFIYEK